MLDERAPPSPASAGRPVDSVQQLAHRDHADGAFLPTEQRLHSGRGDAVLDVDQQVGVDQDGQG